jgi:hypothetical protein
MVVGAGQLQRATRVTHRSGDVAAGLGQRRAVDQDRRRCRAKVLGDRPGGCQVLVVGACLQRRISVVETGLQPIEVTGQHPCPARHDAQHRTPTRDRVRQGLGPAEQQAVLPRATHLRKRLLHQEGGTREVPGNQRVPDGVGGQAA